MVQKYKKELWKNPNNIDFHLQEEFLITSNYLSKFLSSIVLSLPPLLVNIIYDLRSPNFPIILTSDAKAKPKTLKGATPVH